MNMKIPLLMTMISLMLLAGCQPASYYQAEKAAEQWIKSAPTYAFDGTELKLASRELVEGTPQEHVITYRFTSLHGGYGNRTGQIVTQALAQHEIIVRVIDERIDYAVIDKRWDELRQNMLEK